MRGIDVSVFNENIDWQAVKAAGIDFAICRTGFGRTDADETFAAQVDGAHKAGLICGAYHHSYALDTAAAAEEARFCKSIIERAGVMLELPVWVLVADSDGYKQRKGFDFSRANVTAICQAFLDNIKPLNCGVYSTASWLNDFIDWQALGCPVWNAEWNATDSLHRNMWQFTDALKIGGQTFNGNELYDKVSAPTATPTATNAQPSAQNLIHNILSNRPGTASSNTAAQSAPASSTPQQNSSAQNLIHNILSNRTNTASSNTAAQSAPASSETSASTKPQSSAQNLIHNILSNRK
ncbi:MAG: hypothetical protein IJ685_11675 [Selenomonadaceae bacterium]|nr:hypothetical protein [Selenomonadaceae bacterium]